MTTALAVILWAVAVAVVIVCATLAAGAVLGIVRLALGRDKWGNRIELPGGPTVAPVPLDPVARVLHLQDQFREQR